MELVYLATSLLSSAPSQGRPLSHRASDILQQLAADPLLLEEVVRGSRHFSGDSAWDGLVLAEAGALVQDGGRRLAGRGRRLVLTQTLSLAPAPAPAHEPVSLPCPCPCPFPTLAPILPLPITRLAGGGFHSIFFLTCNPAAEPNDAHCNYWDWQIFGGWLAVLVMVTLVIEAVLFERLEEAAKNSTLATHIYQKMVREL